MKELAGRMRKHSGLIIIVLAALLLEAIAAFQYHYAHGLLELELERGAFKELGSSALRIQVILSKAEVAVSTQVWHARRHLSDSEYMRHLVENMVRNEHDNIIGAEIAFRPGYYPDKDSLYEIYALQTADTISVKEIGSLQHDYTKSDFYVTAMSGMPPQWTSPYTDADGAHDIVITYALPLLDSQDNHVGVLGVDLDTDWVGEVINVHHFNPSSFSLVMSERGELIAGPADSLASPALVNKIVAMINDSTVAREKKANGRVTGFPFTDDEGKCGHVYYAPRINKPKWQMVAVCYDDEVFGQLDRMRSNIMWLSLAGLLTLGLIIHLFIRGHRRLQTTQLQQERIGSELRIANEIQMQMLPRENSVVRNDIKVLGSLLPAREVGGDLYDFFLRDEKLFFCVGDVSGKGVPSAMLMAVVHSLFRSASAHENNPAHILKTINETSCQGNEANMFVTLFVGVLDLPTGRLRYCNAGHDKPILIDDDGIADLPCKANLPVGVFSDVKYNMHEMQLRPGSVLFLYTDGLTEAKNIQRKQFGLDSVKELLRSVAGYTPQELMQSMNEAVGRFVEDAEQSDDLTMLVIQYTPVEEKDLLRETLTLKNDPRQVVSLSSFIKDVTARLELEPKMAGEVRLAVEEAVVNVMDYAYPAGKEGEVTVEVRADGRRLKFVISDSGVVFDPTETGKVDTTLSAEDRPIGGLGIHLVRQLMDSINYERVDGKNILTLRKIYHQDTTKN